MASPSSPSGNMIFTGRVKRRDEKLTDIKSRGRIYRRFRDIFVALFLFAFIIMLLIMISMYNRIITEVSLSNAGRYSMSTADILSSHIDKEIGLLSKAAHSRSVIEWLSQPDDPERARAAYIEMTEIVDQLYSHNLYVGSRDMMYEYSVINNFKPEDIQPIATLDRRDPQDDWFFQCLDSKYDYLLGVDKDHILNKKRVWIDHKVSIDGKPIGVICTGLEFPRLAEILFSHSIDMYMRSLVINEKGLVLFDSDLQNDERFESYNINLRSCDAFDDPQFLNEIESYIKSITSYFNGSENPFIMNLSSGQYRYAVVTPIKNTQWSSIVMFNPSALLSPTKLLPAFAGMLLLLICFTLAVSAVSFRLIFKPINLLLVSLSRIMDDRTEPIYGADRDDEIGSLSKTIIDLFTKANYDAMTGVYNRRYMETLLQQNVEYLSRSNGMLSVLMVDVDYFKFYNDEYGHQAGDLCLTTIARTLSESVTRASDFVARYGGEEFIAVLPNTDESGARLIAVRIIENVRMLKMPHAKSAIAPNVTVSVGVTTGKVVFSQDIAGYIKAADDALYASKQGGRDRYTFKPYHSREARAEEGAPEKMTE